jgi:polysaccharide biosynthesis/export protein
MHSFRIAAATYVACLLITFPAATAQTPPPPGTSPDQVQRQIEQRGLGNDVLARLQASGMTPDQIRRRLASMGYDPRTLDVYLQSDSARVAPEPSDAALDAIRALGLQQQDTLRLDRRPERAPLTREEELLGLRVFGVDVFSRGSSNFEPLANAPVPSTYVLGPGDELVLVLTGDVELVHMLPVTREGFILIPQVGQVWVNGVTLQGLRDQLYNRLGAVYSGVRRGGGSTQFDISLARVRTNQVYITGEVAQPGTYAVSPLASALNALYQAGGPTANGSFRNVHVMRGGTVVQRIDLYDFLLRGDNLDRVRLEPGDVIFVPVRNTHVAIRGEVTRPAIYELQPSENLVDLVRFAGGVSAPAHVRRVRVSRVVPPGQRTTPGVDRVVIDVDLAQAVTNPSSALRLELGDVVTVLPVLAEDRNVVTVQGSVWRPGSYEFRPGMRAWDLINAGDGVTPDAYDDRAHISRLNPADSTLTLIPVSLARSSDGTPADNPVLQEFDVLTVYSRAQRVEDLTIDVVGAVRTPGSERYQAGMSLRDAILRAGGLRRVADPVVEVSRLADPETRAAGQIARIYRIPVDSSYFLSDEAARYYLGNPEEIINGHGADQAAQFLLQPHDRVFVRQLADFELPRVVTITGEVAYPGEYTLRRKDERVLSLLLERAGGLNRTAHVDGFQLYRNGALVNVDLGAVMARPGHRDNMVLMPGDSLHVPEYSPVIVVQGAVNSPSSVLYRPGAGLEYYISSAGGYARDADKGRVYVRYANGAGRAVSRSLLLFRRHPEPEPGSVVVVPHVLPEDRTDYRAIISDVVQITAALTTVIVLLRR